MILTCLVVDDEPLALELMAAYVKRTPFLELAGCCSSAVEALPLIRQGGIDVAFLDIQMPDLSGLELSKMIGDRIRVIFTTAFEQYALEGFRVDALDYLLKPISYPEFLRAAGKALRWFEMLRPAVPASAAGEGVPAVPERIFVKSDYKLVQIEVGSILYVEGLKDYVKIYLEGESLPVVSLMSMKALEDLLPVPAFVRVHRSFIVQMDKIRVVERNRIVFGKEYIPVSDSYKARFQELLNNRSASLLMGSGGGADL